MWLSFRTDVSLEHFVKPMSSFCFVQNHRWGLETCVSSENRKFLARSRFKRRFAPQVCQYLEMKDILITSTPALRITCRFVILTIGPHSQCSIFMQPLFRNRRFFDRIARPLARRANPQTHPLVMDTFLRSLDFQGFTSTRGPLFG